jgi:hypothetical protein
MRAWFGPVLAAVLLMYPAVTLAQSPPREFLELEGTWLLDESAGSGRISVPIARSIVITTTPTQLSVTKDSAPVETYRFDGTEFNLVDGRRASFLIVSDMVALTTRRTRTRDGLSRTNIVTDAYAVAGDVLAIERRWSILSQPAGTVLTLGDKDSRVFRQRLLYRRVPQPTRQ